MQRISLLALPLINLIIFSATGLTAHGAELVEHRKVWDAAPHSAFTDLVRYKGEWLLAFREAEGHVSRFGKIRVLKSVNGENWETSALLEGTDTDLRDPGLAVLPDGQLILVAAASWHSSDAPVRRRSLVYLSRDGEYWTSSKQAVEDDYWLWKLTSGDTGVYGFGYTVSGKADPGRITLFKSPDGETFEVLSGNAMDEGSPNEARIRFDENGTAYALLRREGGSKTAMLGTSQPPFADWEWTDLGRRLGGPNFLQLPDGRWIAVGRDYQPGGAKTVVFELKADAEEPADRLTPLLEFPSGGDTSYPGLAFADGLLWISYYSSHEGKSNIYLAKVRP